MTRRRAAEPSTAAKVSPGTTALAVLTTSTAGTQLVDATPVSPYREPRAGEYWRVTKSVGSGKDRSLRKGTVLLVTDARSIDGDLHSVVVSPHPLDTPGRVLKFVLRDFLAHFTFEPEGERVRREEIAALQRSADAEQQALLRGPSPADLGVDPNQVAPVPALPSGPSAATELAKPGVREGLDRAIAGQLQLAEAQTQWLQQRHGAIQRFGSQLTAFYDEQGRAAMARVSEVRAFASQLTQGVRTMGLYLGDNVEVEQLLEGAGAAREVPLTLFQRRLFMDEELAVNFALGGATWRNFNQFAAALAADPTLLERVLPTPRCVVSMAYRHHGRTFDIDANPGSFSDKIGALFRFMQDEDTNKRTFLLIRNGENVYSVSSELATDNAPRLFPTEEDKDKPFVDSWKRRFHGIDGERVGPDDAAYYEARTEYDQVILFYKRLMVLMWGLHDRLNLFGDFFDPAEYPNFMSLRLQAERFQFVYDDETLAIGEGRLDFLDWWSSRNAFLTEGSRLLCNWNTILTGDAAPGLRNARRVDQRNPIGIAIAIRRGDGLGFETLVENHSGRRYNAKVRLGARGSSNGDRSYLVLDAVDVDDLDFYINSRAARPSYMTFLALFMEARTILLAERERERPVREALTTRLRSTYDLDDRALGEAVNAAVRTWRARHRGDALPTGRAAAASRLLDDLKALAAAHVAQHDLARVAAEAAAARAGRTPLRLTQTADGKPILYATTLPQEKPFGDAMPHPWVARAPLLISATGKAARPTFAPALLFSGDGRERVLHDWDGARAATVSSAAHELYSLKQLLTVRDAVAGAVQHLNNVWGGLDVDLFVDRYKSRAKTSRAGWSHPLDAVVPIGIAYLPDRVGERREYRLLCVVENGPHVLWSSGAAGREIALQLLRRIVWSAKDSTSALATAAARSTPHLVHIAIKEAFARGDRDGLSLRRIAEFGYDIAYVHGVTGFGFLSTRVKDSRAWGDDLANALGQLEAAARKPGNVDRLVFLAPGVESWLRGRERPSVATTPKRKRPG